jgi:hypothetical protein
MGKGMPSNNLYESDAAEKEEYVPAANSSLLPRKRPMHGKLTAAILGGSVCLNAMLVLYCVNSRFMKPLAYDRGQELAYLQMKDRELTAQKESLERTTQGLMQQKEQLLQHYKETESVGKKLETYKEKLRVDAQVGTAAPLPCDTAPAAPRARERFRPACLPACPPAYLLASRVSARLCLGSCACVRWPQEVKDAEAAAEVLMQRLATAQGKTISTQQRLLEEKKKLEKAKKELQDIENQQKELKRSEKTDKLVRALENSDDQANNAPHPPPPARRRRACSRLRLLCPLPSSAVWSHAENARKPF